MPKKTKDWLKGKTLPGQDLMFTNVGAKIDNYKAAPKGEERDAGEAFP